MNDLSAYTENDLTAVADRIRKNALNINDELAKRLAVKPGLIARFFPNQFVRQQRQISLDKDREWLLARCKIMEVYIRAIALFLQLDVTGVIK